MLPAEIIALYRRYQSDEHFSLLRQNSRNFVPGEGNPTAKILFVGEAPGRLEDDRARPFIGASGRILSRLLHSVGLKREEVWITNLVKYRPVGNADPLPEQISDSFPYLQEEINIIDPKVVVTLGRHPTKAFMPSVKISEVHGKIFRMPDISYALVPMFHPAVALYDMSTFPKLLEDMKILVAETETV